MFKVGEIVRVVLTEEPVMVTGTYDDNLSETYTVRLSDHREIDFGAFELARLKKVVLKRGK